MDSLNATLFKMYIIGLLVIIMMATVSSREELTLGQLVSQSGPTLEQDGVVILQYHLDFEGALRGFRSNFKNTNKLYFQVWHINDTEGVTNNYTLKMEWEYTPLTGNGEVEMVNLTDFGLDEYNVEPNDMLGFFLPATNGAEDVALTYRNEQANMQVVVGSLYFAMGTKPHVGALYRMSAMGHPNLYSLEYLLYKDGDPDDDDDNILVIIIATVASAVLVIVIIVVVVVCVKQHRNRKSPFKETENDCYGMPIPNDLSDGQNGQVPDGGVNNTGLDYSTIPADPSTPSCVYMEIPD